MYQRSNVLVRTVFVSVLACAGIASSSAQEVPASTEHLARSAEIVAVGKVTATRGEWDQNKTRIVTRVTVAVDEYLKGDAGSVMTIISPGGEVDGVGEWYSHTARFKSDEEVVVFAERDTKGNFRVAGGQAGKLSIKKVGSMAKPQVSEHTTLDDLKGQVKNALKQTESN
jgi:hypothetical protein